MLFENAASPDSAARPSLRHSAESFQSTELAPLSPKQCTSGESSPIGSLTPSFWRRSLSGVTAALRTSPRQKSAELDEVASLSPKSIGANASIQPGAADALFVKTSLVMVPETLSGYTDEQHSAFVRLAGGRAVSMANALFFLCQALHIVPLTAHRTDQPYRSLLKAKHNALTQRLTEFVYLLESNAAYGVFVVDGFVAFDFDDAAAQRFGPLPDAQGLGL